MFWDIGASFFGGAVLGPGFILGMTVTAFSSVIREDDNKQYRPEWGSKWWLLCLIPFATILALKPSSEFVMGDVKGGWVSLSQSVVTSLCFVATWFRVKRLPERPGTATSD